MINKIKKDIFQLFFHEFGSCVYVLKLDNKNILIDTSSPENKNELLNDLSKLKLKPEDINFIILTHSHWDHIGNLNLFKNAKIITSKNLNELSKQLKIIATPGHTSDSICLLYQDVLFSGDTLFHNGIGRTDFPESNPKKMQESLEKLEKIKNKEWKILCPGHIN